MLKLDVTIPAEGGVELGGWLFLPEGQDHAPRLRWRMVSRAPWSTASRGLLRHSPLRASLFLFTIIATSEPAAATFAEISIRGSRSPTGARDLLFGNTSGG